MKKLIAFAVLLTNVSFAQIVNEGPGHFVDTVNYKWEFDKDFNPLAFSKGENHLELELAHPEATISNLAELAYFTIPMKMDEKVFNHYTALFKEKYQDLGNDESYFDAKHELHINLIKHKDCMWVQVMYH